MTQFFVTICTWYHIKSNKKYFDSNQSLQNPKNNEMLNLRGLGTPK